MRREEMFNYGWEFNLVPFGQEAGDEWTPVILPHDWLIYDTENLYQDGTARYRKRFRLEKKEYRHYMINFEGVYMDSTVYVNHIKIGDWRYGYSTFEYDITDALTSGENEILVEIRHRSPNTRWYSGSGIFRDVFFKEVEDTYIITDGVYISARACDVGNSSLFCRKASERSHDSINNCLPWKVTVDVEVAGDADDLSIEHSVRRVIPDMGLSRSDVAPENGFFSVSRIQTDAKGWHLNDFSEKNDQTDEYVFSDNEPEVIISELNTYSITDRLQKENSIICVKSDNDGRKYYRQAEEYYGSDEVNTGSKIKVGSKYRTVFKINNPYLWDITVPNLYELTTVLKRNGCIIDEVKTVFGLRTVEFTADNGCYLNGRHIKLYGVCEHHDLGALGAAFNEAAMRRKIMILKEMGVNAIRTSHNMPARKLLRLADEMGILVDCEAFDMWRRVKTEFDYHNYFDECYAADVESWIRRDRNHPCIIMWSIGNEIYDCHADEAGFEITKELRRNVEKHDYFYNARATHGSNYMQWEGAARCTENLLLAGYNYGERCYGRQHEEHPEWMIYGSETASTVQSRGIYHFPLSTSVMADDDEQCSSLGNCTTSWGAESQEWVVRTDRDAGFSQGQFIWSGFDYIGEPTPYHTKNSYFGVIDTAGFPKDAYYIYKSGWTDPKKTPFVHLFPYWDFNEGQLIDVRVCSNLGKVELFVNGRSQGIQYIDRLYGNELIKSWRIPYVQGKIEAVGYGSNGEILAREVRKSFKDAVRIIISDSYSNGDMLFLEISTADESGNPVENDSSRIKVTVSGGGELAGLDNGDSTDFENYKCDCRRLFSGKLLAMVKITGSNGIKVCAESTGLIKAEYIYGSYDSGCSSEKIRDVQLLNNCISLNKRFASYYNSDIPIRKLELYCNGSRKLTKENMTVTVKAAIYPADSGYRDISWQAVNDYAVESNLCSIEPYSDEDGYFCRVSAKGDGSFRLRCTAKNGGETVKVISVLEFSCDGIGTAYLNPYGFVAGSLYTDSKGDVGNGNEKGVATPQEEAGYIGYENLDFGDFGSDELTIPIFTLDSREYKIGIWEGKPYGKGSTLLCDGRYCRPSIWNVYQPETFKLNRRLKGITSLYFTSDAKFHIKGFEFTRMKKAVSSL